MSAGTPGVSRRPLGRLADGRAVEAFVLDNGRGLQLEAIPLGGIVTALRCPDRDGHLASVVLGLARLDDHLEINRNFGSLVGRHANRIAHGRFVLDGRPVQLACGAGPHSLHGGPDGFGARWWHIEPLPVAPGGSVAIALSLASEDGDQGYPGRLQVDVRYTLTPANEWRIDYRATTDAPTVVNLTHHAYWNLAGAGAGSALQHRLTLAASRFAAIDETLIPQRFEPVAGTPLDFRTPRVISERLRDTHPQLQFGRGYDHHFVIDREGNANTALAFAARLEDPASGRVLEVHTTEPGLQFYSGNFLDGRLAGAHGAPLRAGDGLCLETQHPPDGPNRHDVPSAVLRPGEVYASTTVHRLGVLPADAVGA